MDPGELLDGVEEGTTLNSKALLLFAWMLLVSSAAYADLKSGCQILGQRFTWQPNGERDGIPELLMSSWSAEGELAGVVLVQVDASCAPKKGRSIRTVGGSLCPNEFIVVDGKGCRVHDVRGSQPAGR